MSKIPTISNAEWKIMEVIWESPPRTAQQVIDAVGDAEGWKPQTVKTLIGRLVKKGALSFATEANRYLYSPNFSREEAVAAETGNFLDRIARGSISPLLAHLVRSSRPLSEEEIAQLRQLLDEEGKGGSR